MPGPQWVLCGGCHSWGTIVISKTRSRSCMKPAFLEPLSYCDLFILFQPIFVTKVNVETKVNGEEELGC